MRSQVFPISFSVPTPDQFSLDLGLPLEMEPDQTEVYPTAREDSSEDSTIQIAEVQLQFDGTRMGKQRFQLPQRLMFTIKKSYPPKCTLSSKMHPIG